MIAGETVPDSSVTISINSPLIQLSTTSDNNGNFSYTYTDTADMNPGDYQATAIVQTQTSYESSNSLAVDFTILSATSPTNPQEPACNISTGDLDCDGKVDLTDFSILLYYWGTNSALADINGDGIVNLVDFSIIMYYWTG